MDPAFPLTVHALLPNAPTTIPVLLGSLRAAGVALQTVLVCVHEAHAQEKYGWEDLCMPSDTPAALLATPSPLTFLSRPGLHLMDSVAVGAAFLQKATECHAAWDRTTILALAPSQSPAAFVPGADDCPTTLMGNGLWTAVPTPMIYAPNTPKLQVRHYPALDVYHFLSGADLIASPGLAYLMDRRKTLGSVLDLAAGGHTRHLAHACHDARIFCVGRDAEFLRTAATCARTVLVRGHPFSASCIKALAPRAPLDAVCDHDPDRTMEQACFAAAQYPRLLHPSKGIFVSTNHARQEWVPHILMALAPEVRSHARVLKADIVLDLALARDAWIQEGAPKQLYTWLASTLKPSIVMVLGAEGTIALYSFAQALVHASPESRVCLAAPSIPQEVRDTLRAKALPNAELVEGDLWALASRAGPIDVLVIDAAGPAATTAWLRNVHPDGLVIGTSPPDDMPQAHCTASGLGIASYDTSLLRDIMKRWPSMTLGAAAPTPAK